ncbi:hypothetical protein MN608_02895 [Microdochium nivale]|nr:hypothetical protein MN608_02895 [Microdochium nivale]
MAWGMLQPAIAMSLSRASINDWPLTGYTRRSPSTACRLYVGQLGYATRRGWWRVGSLRVTCTSYMRVVTSTPMMLGSERNPARPYEWNTEAPDEGNATWPVEAGRKRPYEWRIPNRKEQQTTTTRPAESWIDQSSGSSSYWSPFTVKLRSGWPQTPLVQGRRPPQSAVKFKVEGTVPDVANDCGDDDDDDEDNSARLVFMCGPVSTGNEDIAYEIHEAHVDAETRRVDLPLSCLLALPPGQYNLLVYFWVSGRDPVPVLGGLTFEVVRAGDEQGPERVCEGGRRW